jgi:hypothetical protein
MTNGNPPRTPTTVRNNSLLLYSMLRLQSATTQQVEGDSTSDQPLWRVQFLLPPLR